MLPDIFISSLACSVVFIVSFDLEGTNPLVVILLLVELVVYRLVFIIIIEVHIIAGDIKVIKILNVVAVFGAFTVVRVEPHLISHVVPRRVTTNEA